MRTAWIIAILMMAGAARGEPVPPPPADFGSTQYIDGAGCVFLREGTDWVPRPDGTGGQLCGFPPSLATRRSDPDTVSVLAPMHPDPPPRPEDVLAETLASGLRQGEFTADPAPRETRRDAPAPSQPPAIARNMARIAAQQDQLRAAASGAGRSDDLCAALGYRPDPDPRPLIGGDVTQGMCYGMQADVPTRRISDTAHVVPEEPAPVAEKATDKPAETVSKSVPATASVAPDRPKAATTGTVADRRQPRPAAPERLIEMIPASARYVQVGAYMQDDAALATIRRLSEMGYRTGQSYERRDDRSFRLIMAGPFTNRQDLIAALSRLRGSGYPHAVAR